MADPPPAPVDSVGRLLDAPEFRDWLSSKRWYASKTRAVNALELVESAALGEDPILLLAIAQARLATGMHHLYQLPLGLRSGADCSEQAVIAHTGGWGVYDALSDPTLAFALMARIDAGGGLATSHGRYLFHRADAGAAVARAEGVRAINVEQSNTSVVFGDRVVLKVFRRLESGINPELELLRFLASHSFENIAALHGWYEYEGPALVATLGVAQEFLAGAVGGWELGLQEARSDPETLLTRLAELGDVTAALHATLASDNDDPAFAPTEPSQEWMSLVTATLDEDIEDMFSRLGRDERLAPLSGRAQEIRGRLATLGQLALGGRLIRTHGDYHLGQTLHTADGWVVIDFEGEPARSLSERRRKHSALRDVAGMLRSFAYLSAASSQRGAPAPEDFEERARRVFLDAYFSRIEPTLLPAGEAAARNLLAIFELERAIYELQYELEHRPDWLSIPVSAITRLLESR
ncbi:MAG: phosphotransferase [Solirubrobacteraceae bacterium]